MKLRDAIYLTVGTVWRKAKESEARAARAFRVADILGNVDLGELTTARVTDLADRLDAEGLAPTTVGGYLSVLRTVLTAARDRGHLTSLPVFPKRAPDRRRKRWLREWELAELLGAVADLEIRGFLLFLSLTGARFEEARGAEWRHFRKTADGFTVTFTETKSGEPREVPLADRLQSAMRTMTAAHPGSDGPFLHLSESRIRRAWKAAKDSLTWAKDDDDLVIHTLRHTCATRLLDEGVDITTVSRLLGHASVATTGIYVHQTEAAQRRLAEALNTLS